MHANARLTPIGRLTMVMRIESGRPVAHVAAEMGISRPTAHKWWNRWNELGEFGLVERVRTSGGGRHRRLNAGAPPSGAPEPGRQWPTRGCRSEGITPSPFMRYRQISSNGWERLSPMV